MQEEPRLPDDPLYRLLRDGKVGVFNQERAAGRHCDLRGCDFRGVDLRGLNADGLDLSHCYFRQADLRGVDFTGAVLEGASIHASKIAGAYFPAQLCAEEITLSLLHGTRMRYRS
ncbi:MAG TPA: pentapeptide repeat-containing protein [Gammaproteobacteria bacterium]|nr:pentapeptide repeat-containing protein [Gammaproteobacteria bacterium]